MTKSVWGIIKATIIIFETNYNIIRGPLSN